MSETVATGKTVVRDHPGRDFLDSCEKVLTGLLVLVMVCRLGYESGASDESNGAASMGG